MLQQLDDLADNKRSVIEHMGTRDAADMVHKLLYSPVHCGSVRVGANELDEVRAVTIHYDSLCICGELAN